MLVKSKCKNKDKKKKVLHLHSLHGLRSAFCSLHGLRFGVTGLDPNISEDAKEDPAWRTLLQLLEG